MNRSVLDVLAAHAERTPDRIALTLISRAGEEKLTCAGLWELALRAHARLVDSGVRCGDRLVVALTRTNRAHLGAILGSMLAGAHTSSIGITGREQIGELAYLAAALKPCLIVGDSRTGPLAAALRLSLPTVIDGESLLTGEANPPAALPRPEHVGYLQLSSGTTAHPKAIMLSHAGILANLDAVRRRFYEDHRGPAEGPMVSWLPLFHDMGLFGVLLAALYSGVPVVLMDPFSFAKDPLSWLRMVTSQRASYTMAPTFAYGYCARMLRNTSTKGIDLRTLQTAAIGAEPLTVNVMRNITAAFGAVSLRPDALTPVYGLAESTVFVSGTPGRPPHFDWIDHDLAETTGEAIPLKEEDGGRGIVSNGQPAFNAAVRIVDAAGFSVGERRVGHIQIAGIALTVGWHTDQGFRPREEKWLDTGDLGYLADGELYVIGREKDIIIKRGRNIVPHRIEEIAAGVPGVRADRVVAFGLYDEDSATERIILVTERATEAPSHIPDWQLALNIRTALSHAGCAVDSVWIAPRFSIPLTSSGKLRRVRAKELYLAYKGSDQNSDVAREPLSTRIA